MAWMYGGGDSLYWTTACDSHMYPGGGNDYCECRTIGNWWQLSIMAQRWYQRDAFRLHVAAS